MIYIRGNSGDYDDWQASGADGWSYRDVLPYFRRAEANGRLGQPFHGTDGPLHVEDPVYRHELTTAWVESALEAGADANDDFNGHDQLGVGFYQTTTHRRRRCSTADAYLRPAMMRGNLTVRTNVLVNTVIIDGGRARGVRYRDPDGSVVIAAAAEVIVCAGSIASPQLLLRSGVGSADSLRRQGIEVASDVPGVGENLHDHPTLPVIWTTTGTTDLRQAAADPAAQAEWARSGTGPASSNIGEAGGFFSTTGNAAPDLQIHAAPLPFADRIDPEAPAGFTALLSLLTPRCRGSVGLGDTNPAFAAGDRASAGCRRRGWPGVAPRLPAAAGAEQGRALNRLLDRPYLRGRDDQDSGEFEAYTHRWLQTLYHPVGTCAMGLGPASVVDPELHVHGVEGLRVVDASVMPTIPRGNTNAAVIMIAEKAADLIRDRMSEPANAGLALPQAERVKP